MAARTKQRVQIPAGKHLTLAVPVYVQCEGFRCLAYRDKSGNWINYYSGEPLQGTVTPVGYEGD